MILVFSGLGPLLNSQEPRPSPCDENTFVQVEGDVPYPGVYPFCHQPSMNELIQASGGLKPGLKPITPDEGAPLVTGTGIVIHVNGNTYRATRGEILSFQKLTLGMPLSLNRETEEGLTAIPGIGPALARTIVEQRNARGGFSDISELRGIRGVGPKIYEKLRQYLVL